jgi:hypothetical protein
MRSLGDRTWSRCRWGPQEAVKHIVCVDVVPRDRPRRVDGSGEGRSGARGIERGEGAGFRYEGAGFGRSVRVGGCLLSVQLQAFEKKVTPNKLLKSGKAGT